MRNRSVVSSAVALCLLAAAAPSESGTVYAMGIDLGAPPEDPSEGKHIYLSRDGGVRFTAVGDKSAAVTIVNGPVMEVSPADANVLCVRDHPLILPA